MSSFKLITSLPFTKEQLDSWDIEKIVETIEDLQKPDTRLEFHARMHVDDFLMNAAYRLVEDYRDREQVIS